MTVLSKLPPISWAAAMWSVPAVVLASMPLGMFVVKAQGRHSSPVLTCAAIFGAFLVGALVLWVRGKNDVARGAALGSAGLPVALALAFFELQPRRARFARNGKSAYGPLAYIVLLAGTTLVVALGALVHPPLYGWLLVLVAIFGGVGLAREGASRQIATGVLVATLSAFLLRASAEFFLWLFNVTA